MKLVAVTGGVAIRVERAVLIAHSDAQAPHWPQRHLSPGGKAADRLVITDVLRRAVPREEPARGVHPPAVALFVDERDTRAVDAAAQQIVGKRLAGKQRGHLRVDVNLRGELIEGACQCRQTRHVRQVQQHRGQTAPAGLEHAGQVGAQRRLIAIEAHRRKV